MPNPIDVSVLDTGIKTEHLKELETWGQYLAERDHGKQEMSTSQIRKFFGEIKRIQANFDDKKEDIVLLDPKIAYAVGRAKKDAGKKKAAIEDFYNMISPMIRYINSSKTKYQNFVNVCEAIVAYHKAKGGR